MLLMHDLIDRGVLIGEMLLQPDERRSHCRILIPQTLCELHDKCRGHGARVATSAHQRVRIGNLAVDAEQPVGDRIGLLARDAAADDA